MVNVYLTNMNTSLKMKNEYIMTLVHVNKQKIQQNHKSRFAEGKLITFSKPLIPLL